MLARQSVSTEAAEVEVDAMRIIRRAAGVFATKSESRIKKIEQRN